MTAVIHHGAPGSYKTFSIVQRVLIPALQSGRVVITNIRGFNSIDRIRDQLKIEIPDTAQILYLEPDDTGYEILAKFFHWAPAGALIAMDEGQRVYPMREKRFDHLDQPSDIVICDAQNNPLIDCETNLPICRPSSLENAFDQHRHFNWDIYISTPNISKIHGEIRKTVEWAYRHRDNSGLLPWYKNSWTEFRHDAEQNGKSLTHYSGSPKRYKADKKIFDCYQSTATGTAKTTNENISIFRDPKLRLFGLLFVIAIAIVVYEGKNTFERLEAANNPAPETMLPVDPAPSVSTGRVSPNDRSDVNTDKSLQPRALDVNPLAGVQIYFTGSINAMLLFEIRWPDNTVTPIQLTELEILGYRLSRRFGAFVAFDLHGRTVYAFPKPRAPIGERGATMERNATQLSASVL